MRLLDSAEAFRARRGHHGQPLQGKSLAMIFEKPSTRTRVSLEVAAAELGGHPLYLSAGELQLGRGETIADTARVLSRYVHGITARVYSHSTVVQLAEHATVPVVNALSDWEHPLQILADLQTMRQRFRRAGGPARGLDRRRKQRLQLSDPGLGHSGYGDHRGLARRLPAKGPNIGAGEEPWEAGQEWSTSRLKLPQGADVLVTDTWISMGDEGEEAERLRVFGKYQVNAELMGLAAPEPSPCTACLLTGARRSPTR